ncbi:Inosine-guanosine phosphorylase [Intoshia linei]|uniref:purine-nucleoside phosphorylase n=1 Tax=Intoshia linei TaxID=1819745 RepID=A0A177B710_9BILA|nr:Inosine-guanosine phosphorylase [Intoshia linei]
MYKSQMYDDTADYLNNLLRKHNLPIPKYGIICGSGLGKIADKIGTVFEIEYSDIPNFPMTTVIGHAGKLAFCLQDGNSIVIMKGRFHCYEGHSPQSIAFVIRILKLLGVHLLLITNASGALNPDYEIGDIIIIKDQICLPGLAGIHPLSGYNDPRFGPRFPPMSNAFDKSLQNLAMIELENLKIRYNSGVYIMVHGPTLESVTEANYLRMIGGDVVGMSTAMEIISAHHCGIKVNDLFIKQVYHTVLTLTLALITNKVVKNSTTNEFVSHEKVLKSSMEYSNTFVNVLYAILNEISVINEYVIFSCNFDLSFCGIIFNFNRSSSNSWVRNQKKDHVHNFDDHHEHLDAKTYGGYLFHSLRHHHSREPAIATINMKKFFKQNDFIDYHFYYKFSAWIQLNNGDNKIYIEFIISIHGVDYTAYKTVKNTIDWQLVTFDLPVYADSVKILANKKNNECTNYGNVAIDDIEIKKLHGSKISKLEKCDYISLDKQLHAYLHKISQCHNESVTKCQDCVKSMGARLQKKLLKNVANCDVIVQMINYINIDETEKKICLGTVNCKSLLDKVEHCFTEDYINGSIMKKFQNETLAYSQKYSSFNQILIGILNQNICDYRVQNKFKECKLMKNLEAYNKYCTTEYKDLAPTVITAYQTKLENCRYNYCQNLYMHKNKMMEKKDAYWKRTCIYYEELIPSAIMNILKIKSKDHRKYYDTRKMCKKLATHLDCQKTIFNDRKCPTHEIVKILTTKHLFYDTAIKKCQEYGHIENSSMSRLEYQAVILLFLILI